MSLQGNAANWKQEIIMCLKTELKIMDGYAPLIKSYNRLMDKLENAKQLNEALTKEIEIYKSKEYKESDQGNNTNVNSEVQSLKEKLLHLNEEFINSMKNKSENSHQFLDITNKLKEREDEIISKNHKIDKLEAEVTNLRENLKDLEMKYEESKTNIMCLSDELQALQMAYTSLENDHVKLRKENLALLNKISTMQQDIVVMLNKENEEFQTVQNNRRISVIEEKIAGIHIDIPVNSICIMSRIPSVPLYPFDAHEGEVTSIVWNSNGKNFITGGGDRKVKNWEIVGGGKCESRGYLSESNGGITSVTFDSENKYLMSTSNDFACRIYDYAQNRITSTLTGHSGKCCSAKFINDGVRVASGGNDRILKIWDFHRIACLKSIFVGSTTNDIAVMDENNIISGHFDGNIRIWDIRCETHKEFKLQVSPTRITSLDISPDKRSVLCCSRNDQLSIVDTRQKKIINEFRAEGFHVPSDCSRAVFSPDLMYVAAGSSDGSIYIWNIQTNKVEAQLKEHKDAVLAVAWSPSGTNLLSASKSKIVVLWSDI